MVNKRDVIVSLIVVVIELLRHGDGVGELLVDGLHGVREGDGVTGDVIQLDGGGHLVRLVVSDIIGGAARPGIQITLFVRYLLICLILLEKSPTLN